MPQFFSESAPMPQNRFISWDKAVFLLSGEKPPYFKGCSGFFRLFRALHVKPMRDVFALLPIPAVDGEEPSFLCYVTSVQNVSPQHIV